MIRRPPRSTRTDTLSLHDALPISSGAGETMSWDQDKLAALREKYAKGHGGDLFDPSFQKVADKIFSKWGTRKAPYAGVSTLLDAPYRQIDPQDPDFGDLQVAIVGVPMDLGVTTRPGARDRKSVA